MKINYLDHVAIAVKDLPTTLSWYERNIGLKRKIVESWRQFPVLLVTQDEHSCIAVFPSDSGNPYPMPADVYCTIPHFALNVDPHEFEQAQKTLQKNGIDFHFQDHSICKSIYIRDPDDYCVEITTYVG